MEEVRRKSRECVAVSGENIDAKRPLIIIRRRIWCYLFCIPVLVQGSQLNERAFRVSMFPLIEFHDDAMHGKEQIVIRLLKRLSNGIEFTLVRPAVVRLRLSRHRADEVGVNAHGKADHIDSLLDVGGPIAALLALVNPIDDHIMLLLAVRRDVERGEERFAAVLGPRQKVNDKLLLLDDPVLLLLDVRDAFPLEDALPVALRHLDVVFERSRVLQSR